MPYARCARRCSNATAKDGRYDRRRGERIGLVAPVGSGRWTNRDAGRDAGRRTPASRSERAIRARQPHRQRRGQTPRRGQPWSPALGRAVAAPRFRRRAGGGPPPAAQLARKVAADEDFRFRWTSRYAWLELCAVAGFVKGILNMDQTFDSDGFIRRIGQRLVDEFKDAKAGTTPSTVGAAPSLQDAFRKVASAKQLQRHIVHQFMPNPTTGEPIPSRRHYLTSRGDAIVQLDEGRDTKERRQIFGFVLAGESRLKQGTLAAHFLALAAEVGDTLSPNLLATLDGHALNWGTITKQERKETYQSKDGTYGL